MLLPRRLCRRLALAAALVLVSLGLSACDDEPQWRTTALDSGFPDLAFELRSESGETTTEGEFDGKVTLLFFGYTSCPDVCPATLARLNAAVDSLPEAEQRQVRVLFVSVDPGRDDAERLAAYTSAFGPQIVGATAEEAELRRLAKRYASTFSYGEPDDSGGYLVSHSSTVLVFDADGTARLLMRPDDPIGAITEDLARLLGA